MQSSKITTPTFITNTSRRKVTCCKRKRGLFKKAIELSEMCGLEVFLVVFDPEKQKIFELNSKTDFDVQLISHLLDKVNKQQFVNKHYTNNDFGHFLLEKPEPSSDKGDKGSDIDTDSESEQDLSQNNKQKKGVKKRGYKCYKKDQQNYLKSLEKDDYYEDVVKLEEKLAKYVKPEKQSSKYKMRFEVAQRKQKNSQEQQFKWPLSNIPEFDTPLYNDAKKDQQIESLSNLFQLSKPLCKNAKAQICLQPISHQDTLEPLNDPKIQKMESSNGNNQDLIIPNDCFLKISPPKINELSQKGPHMIPERKYSLKSPINMCVTHYSDTEELSAHKLIILEEFHEYSYEKFECIGKSYEQNIV